MIRLFPDRRPIVRVAVTSAAVFGVILSASPVLACVFFPEEGMESDYVDPTAVRVLLERHGTQTTATYQIQYTGGASSFALLVPVPSLPEIGVADHDPFPALDDATAPILELPPPPSSGGGASRSSGGCGGDRAIAGGIGADDMDASAEQDPRANVEVWSSQQVGPYQVEVVSAQASSDLRRWLEENSYYLPSEDEAILAQYIAEGFFFVAARLARENEAAVMSPIQFTYVEQVVALPLRLNQTAPIDGMGLLVYILGDTQFVPANYTRLSVPDASIWLDPDTEETNYGFLVSQAANAAGDGRGFVTEYAVPTSTVLDSLWNDPETATLVESAAFLTRLYTRIDAAAMTIDPVFEPAPMGTEAVSRYHQVRERGETEASLARPGKTRLAGFGGIAPVVAVLVVWRLLRRRARRP